MSDIAKKELASALKWTWVIVVAAIAYYNVAPNYYFMRQGSDLFHRGNKITGSIEYLDYEIGDTKWVDITEIMLNAPHGKKKNDK